MTLSQRHEDLHDMPGGRVTGAEVISELITELDASVEAAAGFEGEMQRLSGYARCALYSSLTRALIFCAVLFSEYITHSSLSHDWGLFPFILPSFYRRSSQMHDAAFLDIMLMSTVRPHVPFAGNISALCEGQGKAQHSSDCRVQPVCICPVRSTILLEPLVKPKIDSARIDMTAVCGGQMHSAVNTSAQEPISNVSYPTLVMVPVHSTCRIQAKTGGRAW